jgi:phosphotransferase system enzyme I (PtsI)
MLLKAEEIILTGNQISIGIAIGKPFFLNRGEFKTLEQTIPESGIDAEINRYRTALSRSGQDITRLQKQLESESESALAGISILDAQLEMLHDPLLTVNIEGEIRQTNRNAEFILQKALHLFKKKFEDSEDPFFYERFKDLKDLSERIFSYLQESGNLSLHHVPPDSIVCTQELTSSDAAEATASNVNAFITETGGATSHAAIVAKAKGIPYVTGISLRELKESATHTVIVDGRTGTIILNPSETTLKEYETIRQSILHQFQKLEGMSRWPAETYDGYPIRLFANLETPDEIDLIHHLGGRGVGLFRSEYIFLPKNEIPNEDDQYNIYSRVMEKMNGLPVVIRTFDLGGDKTSSHYSFQEEHNSFLGCRATRFLLREKALFKSQLRAIVRAGLYGDLSILFPMITTLSELREAKKIVHEVQEELGLHKKIRIGCMIEVPSAALIAEHFARECDFLSIGTNDLVQYTLAVHRGDHSLSEFYEPTDPSIIRLIKIITHEANKESIPVAVCGEIASDPRFTSLLLGLGVQELSVIPRCLPFIKNAIRNTSLVDAVQLAEKALTLKTAQEVFQLISDDYQKNVPHDLFYNI